MEDPFTAAGAWRKWSVVDDLDLVVKFELFMDSAGFAKLHRWSEYEWLWVHAREGRGLRRAGGSPVTMET